MPSEAYPAKVGTDQVKYAASEVLQGYNATSENYAGAGAKTWTFIVPGATGTAYTVTALRVENRDTSTAVLYVAYTGTASATSKYTTKLPAGATLHLEGFAVTSVSIYADAAATHGTHFNVMGWR